MTNVMLKKLQEVFSLEFREKVNYHQFIERKQDDFKLKSKSESVDSIVERLKGICFESNFQIITT